jgi:glycosyltransferase involved in cell wall biosynthesis
MATPLVTIGISYYNAEKYLRDAILSILNQSYSNWELILIDDGSTDNSLDIAKTFNDSRIFVYSDGINRGLCYRLNQITNLAKGKYIARMDADDIMHRNRLSKQVNYLLLNPKVDVLGTAYCTINESNHILRLSKTTQYPNIKKNIYSGEFMGHPTVMTTKDWYLDNPYDPKYVRVEDRELWIRTKDNSKYQNILEPLLFYRVETSNQFSKYCTTNINLIRLFINGIITHKIPLQIAFVQVPIYVIKILFFRLFINFNYSSNFIYLRYNKLSQNSLDNLNKQLKEAIAPII